MDIATNGTSTNGTVMRASRWLAAGVLGLATATCAFAQSADELKKLENQIMALSERIERLEDLGEVEIVQRAYGYYVDKSLWYDLADLWTEDGTLEIGGRGVFLGKDRVFEYMNVGLGPIGPRRNLLVDHQQFQTIVTIHPDGKTAELRGIAFVMSNGGWGHNYYENDYVKEDGVWKIAEMRYYTNFVAPYEGGWAALKPVSGDWKTPVAAEFPPDAPAPVSYRPFPDVYVPPFHYAKDLSAIQSIVPPAPKARPNDALGRLEAMVDHEALKLARLSSLRAVENLQAMYGYYVDKGLWKEAASLFTEDGTWEFGQSGVYAGRASVERGLATMGPAGLERGQLNNYPMLQPIITVSEDNKTAKGRWRSDVMLARDGKGRWGGGVYENEYVNENGTWKIKKQHYYVTFWADYDLGFAGRGLIPMDPPSTANPPDAPPTTIYESLPNTYIVPFHFNHPVTGQPHKYLDGGQ